MFKRPILIVVLLALALTSIGCQAPAAQSPSMDYLSGGAPAAEPAFYAVDKAAESDSARNSAGEASVERLVIRNADLSIATADPGVSLEAIAKMAEEMTGFVVSSRLYKTYTEDGVEVPAANITVRVPAERLTEALDTIKALVADPAKDIIYENVTGDDVTDQYTDLRSRLTNLENTEKQLQEIMDEANKTEDVLNVYNQLVSIREQIEVTKGQIKYYEESAALSAVSVNIQSLESVAPLTIGKWQPVGVARDAIQALVNTLKFLANAAIWIILFFVPVGLVIYFPLRFLWKGLKRLFKGKPKNKPAANLPAVPPSEPPAA